MTYSSCKNMSFWCSDMLCWRGDTCAEDCASVLICWGFVLEVLFSCGSAEVEAAGIEPHASHTPPDASDTHIHAQTAHIRALPPGRDPHDPPHNAPSIHEQPTGVHRQRARSVHADLQAVITAWPTLSEAIRAQILRLVETGEVRA